MLGGIAIGFFCLRRRGIYFAMLTLAFAQLLYFIAFHMADVTGGDDGLRGIPLLPLNLFGWKIDLESSLAFYYFTFVVVWLAVAGLKRILDSPFGTVLQAIRENGDRASACGYDVNRVKHLSFVFSAFFAGLAGGAGRAAAGRGARRVAVLGHLGAGGDHDPARRRGHLLRSLRRRRHLSGAR